MSKEPTVRLVTKPGSRTVHVIPAYDNGWHEGQERRMCDLALASSSRLKPDIIDEIGGHTELKGVWSA